MWVLFHTSMPSMDSIQSIWNLRGVSDKGSISLLLFVLIMEYLHQCLRNLQNNTKFNFHQKCEKLHLTNICFADDLILFRRGDDQSVQIMMKEFSIFSKSTRLRAKHAKCKVYYGEVQDNVRQIILDVTNFSTGMLPFEYLGIPLCSTMSTPNWQHSF